MLSIGANMFSRFNSVRGKHIWAGGGIVFYKHWLKFHLFLVHIFRNCVVLMAVFIATILQTETVIGYKCPKLPQCYCNKEVTSVDCRSRNLTSIPDIPSTALRLDLSYNNISTLPARVFSKLSKLLDLNLRSNKIYTVAPGTFDKLTSIQTLDLSFNRINTVAPGTFDKLTSIQTLDLSHNRINTVAPGTFDKLTSIQTLDLSYNEINTVAPGTFDKLTSIQTLYLRGNGINTVAPGTFDKLTSIQTLDLSVNEINTVAPGTFDKLTSIQTLDLSDNKINTVAPGTFDKLTSIQTLDLSHNWINTVAPGTFDKLTSIQTLDLSHNWINTVAPGTFDKLTSIQTLDLSHNWINTVAPGTFDKLTSIQTLDLSVNKIRTVAPGTFDKLTSIQTLDLSVNEINTVAPGTFDKLTSIQTLDLSHNWINTVAPGTFDKLTSIQTLDLSHNWINTVAPGTFDKLTSIQTLDLSVNEINTVAPGTFDKLTSIQTLDLSDNKINTVAPGTFDKLTSIQTLGLRYNPLGTEALTNIADGLSRKHLTRLDLSGVFRTQERLKTRLSVLMNISIISLGLCSRFSSFISEIVLEEYRNVIIIRLTEFELFQFSKLKFPGTNNLLWIDLAEMRFTTFPKYLPDSLQFLDLQGNQIKQIMTPETRYNLGNLKRLILTNNTIAYLRSGALSGLGNLQVLDLALNVIPVITESNLHGLNNLQELNLTGNQFICNCDLLWFRDWIDSTSIVLPGKDSYTCHGPQEWQGKPLLDFTKDKSNCSFFTKYIFISKYAILGSVSAALFICVISGIFVYRNRWRLRLRLYLLSKRGRFFLKNVRAHEQRANYGAINDDRDQGLYDAYISCSENDHEWVLQHLLPDIDNDRLDDDNIFGGDFKLYYDPRDKDPGKSCTPKNHVLFRNSRHLDNLK